MALDDLLRSTVELAQSLTTRQTLVFTVEAAPHWVLGDADRLQQVLLNLLTNAITHAAESPEVWVRLRRADEAWAELTVRDAGPGIPAAQLSMVFTRYHQGPPGERRKARGMGLGLFIAHAVVTAHGGGIRVDSREGEGATFTIVLPLLAEGAPGGSPAPDL